MTGTLTPAASEVLAKSGAARAWAARSAPAGDVLAKVLANAAPTLRRAAVAAAADATSALASVAGGGPVGSGAGAVLSGGPCRNGSFAMRSRSPVGSSNVVHRAKRAGPIEGAARDEAEVGGRSRRRRCRARAQRRGSRAAERLPRAHSRRA